MVSRAVPAFILLGLMSAACEKCAPGQVANGVARLSVRNLGAIVEIVANDDHCGFMSTAAAATASVSTGSGGTGSVTWTVKDCAIDLSSKPHEITDCNQVTLSSRGKVKVSAKKTIVGTLTGDASQPVAPGGPAAVTIDVTRADLDRFSVKSSDSDAILTQISGSFSAKAQPVLAADAEIGVCKIPTKILLVSNLAYDKALVHIQNSSHDFDIDVAASSVSAVNGSFGGKENAFWGDVTVWGKKESVPGGDHDGLNPNYDAKKFVASYACTSGLRNPISFECGDAVGSMLAEGTARLTIRNVGSIVELVNADSRCGFASSAVLANPTIVGAAGQEGSATWKIDGCTIDDSGAAGAPTATVSADCNQVKTTVRGKVYVTATRTIHGTLTGDPMQPVIPGGPDAVEIAIQKAELDHFAVEATNSDASLTMVSGSIAAKARPRLAVDAELGVCKVPTKNVAFSDVVYSPSTVIVKSGAQKFDVDVATSNLTAVNGRANGQENAISGHITVMGKDETVPSMGDMGGLDPKYDPMTFDSSYACTAGLKHPITYDCSTAIEPRLAQGAARLTVRGFGTLVDRLDKDTTCGFKSPAVLQSAQLQGTVGGIGSVVLTARGCTLDYPAGTVAKTTCTGSQRKVSGRVTVSGTKTLTGRLTGDPTSPVVPMTDGPAVLQIDSAVFDHFEVEEKGTALRWNDGSMKGTLEPRVAADTAQQGACGFETPIARFEGLAYTAPSQIRLRSSSGSFSTTITAGTLAAVNGTWGGDSNQLSGSITLGMHEYSVPVDPSDKGLDPMFDQTTFDREWQCSTVEMPIRFDCRFVKPLAQGAAQLSVLAMGTVSELIEKDTSCGFSSPAVKQTAQIQGNTGDGGGSATYTIAQPCTIQFAQQTTDKTDCNQVSTYVTGQAMVTGTKTVRGYVSGDPDQAIVPTTRDPARVDLSATVTELKVWKDPGGNAITMHTGQIAGTVIPRLAIDQTTGACSIVTPVAELDHVKVQGAQIGIMSQNKYFEMRADSSDLNAQNGNKDGTVNQLTGSISIDGEPFTIPAVGPSVLDPNYDQAAFDRSYACIPNLKVPADDAACNLKEVLGKGAARLLILSIGNLSKMANDDTSCGFSTQSVLTHPSQVEGAVGDYGLMAWQVGGCDLSRPGDSPFQTDCLGRATYVGGGITFSGSRVVTGIRDQVVILIIIRFDSIIPNARDSATIHLDDVELNDFFVNQVEQGASNPTRGLHVISGSMSAEMHPALGEEANTPGKFDVPTPIAHMLNVTASNMSAQVMSQGKLFNVHIDSANLEAMNGSWDQLMLTNRLSGSISIDGQTITLSGGEPLDPSYMQADFDARYACTPNLASLVPPQ